jgi:hypothetical protein
MLRKGEAAPTSEEICEALVRHVEVSGSEVFEKNFMKDGKTVCTVWCMVGPNALGFRDMARQWLEDNGFKED